MKKITLILSLLLSVCILFCACEKPQSEFHPEDNDTFKFSLESIPEFTDTPFVALNDNEPEFSEADMQLEAFESYGNLDSLGRCGVVFACITKELMPTSDREGIGQIKPSGWVTAKYDFVDGKYLYNRCHLIGFQLTGENANEKNLITGTRYMNVDGMLPFENMVADYVKETDNRVLYRVTPIFKDTELVARGVQMEAYSIEDEGDSICFNVYCYNVQPGITINYATGDSSGPNSGTTTSTPSAEQNDSNDNQASSGDMVWIPKSGSKYHSRSGCSNMKTPSQVTKQEAENQGYEPCKKCW